MKPVRLLVLVTAFLVAGGTRLGAQSAPVPGVREEFGQVFAEHETAAAAAHTVEDRRYQAALSALAARAQRAGDTGTLYAVQQTLAGLTTRPAPLPAATLTAMAPYVGGWDCLAPFDYRYSIVLLPDGTFDSYGRHEGTWTVESGRLILHGPDWSDGYDLPEQNGVLTGKTTDGAHDLKLTRRGMGAAAALEASLIGNWTFQLARGGDPVHCTLFPGGAMTDDRHLLGSWQVDGSELVINFQAHRDWRDMYPLPVGPDGVINGHNVFGQDLLLTRGGSGVGTAAAASVSRGAAPGGGAKREEVPGSYFGSQRPVVERVTPTPRR